jgi:exopolysaccharide production protein ExoZ
VAIFFVISGFIMCVITRDNADDFLKMRLIRIVPIYWLCTFAPLLLMVRFAVFKPSTRLTATRGVTQLDLCQTEPSVPAL